MHRARTIDALRALAVHVEAMELWLAKPDDPLTVCLDLVGKCDVYVCVVAQRYGSETADGLSYTETEYDLAVEAGKAVLVFISDDDHPIPPKFVDKGEAATKLDRFKARLRDRHLVTSFTTAEDLAHRVVESVRGLLHERGVKDAELLDLRDFWDKIESQWEALDPPDLRVDFVKEADPLQLLTGLEEQIAGIENFHRVISESYGRLESDLHEFLGRIGCDPAKIDEVPYYENPFYSRDWEWVTLFPNRLRTCELLLAQMRVKWLEEIGQTERWTPEHERHLREAKRALQRAVSQAVLID
ncbi:protein of unknown function [Desulfonatronum thiosulfatophilum]|uniref:DUF4062 domain-containing protein n=2 Tax=Desulfonatronum thiosulfatophilum TaxID=617002 RepID=A0A1G6ASV5_9BACT|nr:protein of unknown function [Desulfonatronum thiosulfatophilum]